MSFAVCICGFVCVAKNITTLIHGSDFWATTILAYRLWIYHTAVPPGGCSQIFISKDLAFNGILANTSIELEKIHTLLFSISNEKVGSSINDWFEFLSQFVMINSNIWHIIRMYIFEWTRITATHSCIARACTNVLSGEFYQCNLIQ